MWEGRGGRSRGKRSERKEGESGRIRLSSDRKPQREKMNAYKCIIVFPAIISGHTCAPTGETL